MSSTYTSKNFSNYKRNSCIDLGRHHKIVWFASVAIGMLRLEGRVDRKVCHFDIFHLDFLQQNTVKLFFPVLRQPCPQSFLVFTLKQADLLGSRLIVTEWRGERHITDRCCNKAL